MIKNPLFVIIATIVCIVAGFFMKSSYIEIFASVMGVLNVWLLARQKVINFLFGAITVTSFMYIYFQTGLYAMVILSFVQLFFNIFGWYYWVKNKGEEDVAPTTKLSTQGIITWTAIIFVATAVWSYLQIKYTNATSPYLDALVAVMGLVGQYLLSKKILENWYIWIGMNLILLVVCATTGLYVMFILNLINLFICIDGLREWKQDFHANKQDTPSVEGLENA